MVPFSPSGHDGFRWCGNSSQTRRFAQNFTLQSDKLQPTFEPQNHENEALNIWVITPNNEGNVGSHGTTTLLLGKGISLGTVDLVLWQYNLRLVFFRITFSRRIQPLVILGESTL